MKIDGSVALVTGANRGLGRHIAGELLARGAAVYATARDPGTVDMMARWDIPKLDPADVARAVVDGVARGDLEILVDPAAVAAKAALAADVLAVYPQLR